MCGYFLLLLVCKKSLVFVGDDFLEILLTDLLFSFTPQIKFSASVTLYYPVSSELDT